MFSIESYWQLMQKAGDLPTHLFRDFDWSSPGLVLRHDVDLSVDFCFRLIEVEKGLDVLSTSFFMVTSDYYNPSSVHNARQLKQISEWGYEVGLHFDPTCYPDSSPEEMVKHVDHEAGILEDIIGRKVDSVSLHCPSVHGTFPLFEGYVNAYDKAFFSDENYISDSCKSFRGKDPHGWLKLAEKRPIQMLLHPLHFQDDSGRYSVIFQEYINNHIDRVNEQFSQNPAFVSEVGTLKPYSLY